MFTVYCYINSKCESLSYLHTMRDKFSLQYWKFEMEKMDVGCMSEGWRGRILLEGKMFWMGKGQTARQEGGKESRHNCHRSLVVSCRNTKV